MSTICLSGPGGEVPDEGNDRPQGDNESTDDGGDQEAACHRPHRKCKAPHDAHGSSRQQRRRGTRRRADEHIPQRNAVLALLAKLPKLVATGILAPAQANSIHTQLRTLLEYLPDEPRQAASGRGARPSLRDVLRANPDLLDAFEPFLSDEDLNELADDEDTDDEVSGDGA